MTLGSLTRDALKIIQSSGKPALTQACNTIRKNPYDKGAVGQALHFYAKNVLPHVLPIFPALIHLSCNAAGDLPENEKSVAASMLLITSSGDIHDDIIDNSEEKFGRKTVYGEYGKEIALLAGDLILVHGINELHQSCFSLSDEKKGLLFDLIAKHMCEIVAAEAKEASLLRAEYVSSEEYFEVIRLKGGVAELHCKIGAIIGGGNMPLVEEIASYGRAIGVLSTLKEEFVDLSDPAELEHRIKHELPPYPMMCATQNRVLREKISAIKEKKRPSTRELSAISRMVLDSSEVEKVAVEFREFGKKELTNPLLKGHAELKMLLEALTTELLVV